MIGFSGDVHDGLVLHPDNEHLVYPLGSTVVIRHVLSKKQDFLKGHDNKISVIKVSPSGKYIASGQKTHAGLQADVIVWDFETRTKKHQLRLHKVQIVTLDFSWNEQYLASQGGIEDKNMLIVWDVETGKSLYGAANKEQVNEIRFFNRSETKILAVLQNGVQILTIDKQNKKIVSLDVNFGNTKRVFTCSAIDQNDQYGYAATKTGDFYEIALDKAIFKRVGPVKKLFSLGISSIKQLPDGDLIIGAGDGTLGRVSIDSMQIVAKSEVMGGITSITFTSDYSHFFCGTNQSNIFWTNSTSLATELRNTCHYSRINDVAFPANYSDVFATCSINDIRIWNSQNKQELLRIQVPNLECNSLAFMYDGKSIISGWSDGKIRAFLPQSGKLLYVINDAHHHGVTAIASTTDCQKIVSGGSEGEVRVWKIGKQTQTMETSLKEHRGRVWSIQVLRNNDQAVSCSHDGSCIIWDLKSYTRVICFFESTNFKQVVFHPDEYQLLTVAADGKIDYWEKFDGQIIRKLDGNEHGGVNTVAITSQGENFITGGEDNTVRVWGYNDGRESA